MDQKVYQRIYGKANTQRGVKDAKLSKDLIALNDAAVVKKEILYTLFQDVCLLKRDLNVITIYYSQIEKAYEATTKDKG